MRLTVGPCGSFDSHTPALPLIDNATIQALKTHVFTTFNAKVLRNGGERATFTCKPYRNHTRTCACPECLADPRVTLPPSCVLPPHRVLLPHTSYNTALLVLVAPWLSGVRTYPIGVCNCNCNCNLLQFIRRLPSSHTLSALAPLTATRPPARSPASTAARHCCLALALAPPARQSHHSRPQPRPRPAPPRRPPCATRTEAAPPPAAPRPPAAAAVHVSYPAGRTAGSCASAACVKGSES